MAPLMFHPHFFHLVRVALLAVNRAIITTHPPTHPLYPQQNSQTVVSISSFMQLYAESFDNIPVSPLTSFFTNQTYSYTAIKLLSLSNPVICISLKLLEINYFTNSIFHRSRFHASH